MNDFGLFEEFLDDFLSVRGCLSSSMIWLIWRRCFRRWWAEAGRRREGAGGSVEEVLGRGCQWTWWIRCMRRWWSKWWRISMLLRWMRMKMSSNSLSRNCFWFSLVRRMWQKRRSHPRRNFWYVILIVRGLRKTKFSFISQRITTLISNNGKRHAMRRNSLSQRKNSQRNSDIIELYLILRALLCFNHPSMICFL